ncbi:hypothetical protein GY45DRAFT_1376365 [Cubamyces sp. BRFM 1775]|nr:hypothetical protein GY45DRAFT_1376365 [Cubamyces sp. BRFM 1775]
MSSQPDSFTKADDPPSAFTTTTRQEEPPDLVLCDDDDWEVNDSEPQAKDGTTISLPPRADTGIMGSATEHTASRPESEVVPPPLGPPTPQPIPLNMEAMSRVLDPDPFATPSASCGASAHSPGFSISHPSVVLAMLVTVWLHVVAHLPYRFCDVLLAVFGFVLLETGHADLATTLRTSLSSCLTALRLEPSFKLYPTCPACRTPHPESVCENQDSCCTECGHPLFKISEEPCPGLRHQRRRGRHAKPFIQTPAKSIAEQLGELLVQPGMEDAISSWRRRSRVAGWLYDFFDGAISKALLGPDGLPFFRRDLPEDPNGELRIGLALGIDW